MFIPHFRLLVFGILVTAVAWFFSVFFRFAHLALQNVNKDYIIFSYFRNFIAKSDQKPKPKNGMNETQILKVIYQIRSQQQLSFSRSTAPTQLLIIKRSHEIFGLVFSLCKQVFHSCDFGRDSDRFER